MTTIRPLEFKEADLLNGRPNRASIQKKDSDLPTAKGGSVARIVSRVTDEQGEPVDQDSAIIYLSASSR